MQTVEPYNSIALQLRSRVFDMGYAHNHFGSSGYIVALEKIIRDVFTEQKIAANDHQVSLIAHNFPLIDSEPIYETPDDDRSARREHARVSAIVEHVLVDLPADIIGYLETALALLKEADDFDLADIDEPVGDSAHRTEMLQEFLERRLNVKITPEAATEINLRTRRRENISAVNLARLLKRLVG